MPFGFVTKAQLDQLRADLTKDLRAGERFREELQYEWSQWFDKFRSLYMRLLKREKREPPTDEVVIGDNPEQPAQWIPPRLRRNLRGF